MHKIATVFRIKFSMFMLLFSVLFSFQAVALTCPNGYHSSETNITNPEQECFTTVTGGKYITHGSLPADFDSSENGTGIRYHGYGDSNDDTLDENTFATVFPSKTIYGDSACRPQDNPYGQWNTVTDWDFERGNEGGGYICWCRLNGENDPLGLYTYKSKWVARGPVGSNDCWKDCAQDCAIITGNVMGWPDSSPKSSLFSNVNIITEDCPAGSYCPGGEVNYGSTGVYECPANSSSTSGQTSCVCDVRYATENGQGATQDNPCVELTGAASCISGTEYWDEVNQECVEKTEDYTFVFNSGEYLPPVYDITSTGYKCHKSRNAVYCDDQTLIESLPSNSWLVHFDNEPTVFSGRSACSDIGGTYKDLSSVAFDSDIIYGSNCWCKATTPFGSSKWILSGTFENGDICGNECAGNCGDHFTWDNDFKKTLLNTITLTTANCDAGYYCPGGEYSILNTTTSHKSCPETYPDSATGAYKIDQCFATISFESNGGTTVESQTFNYDEEITQYSLSEIPVSTRDDYTFVGWYEDSAFAGTPVTTETSFDTSTTLYAKWGCPSGYTGTTDTITDSGTQCRKACDHIVGKTNTGGYKYYNGDQSSCTYTTAVYTIRYVDEDGNALTTTNPTTWTFGETQPFDLTDPEIPEGWLFNAWYTDNLIYQDNGFGNKVTTITEDLVTRLAGTGTTITIYGYRYPEPVFWMTTTQMNAGDLFSFVVRITGDVWVDWDDGYISKIKNLQHWRWEHNYKNAGVYRIGVVSKNVTDYTKSNESTYDSEDSCAAHIYSSFYITNCWTDGDGGTTPLKLAKIEGKLGDVLPTLENGKNANFTDAFCGCENLTGTIPDGFFDKITGQPTLMMFWGTFENTKLSGKIPDGLFGGLDGEYTGSLFEATFYNTNISGPIPENMFGNLHGAPKKCMFSYTFNNTSISGPIPENLFGRIEGAPAYSMFSQTFWQCPNLSGEIPENLFGNLYGAPAYAMFSNTFDGTALSGPIPQDLFRNISGSAKPWMYNRTFAMSPGLTGNITEGFFGTITGPMQEYTFNRTFLGDSGLTGPIPENLFGEVSGTATRGFYETFKGATNIGKDENGNATPIPVNLFKNISGEVNSTNEMFNGTFEDTQYLTSPVPTELFKGITGFLEDNATGTRTSTYTSGGMKNIFNNSNIPTVCDAGQYQYLTGFEVDWNGRVACEICPENFPDSTSGDNVTINKCYTECPADEHGGTYVSGHKYWTSDSVGDTSSCTYKYNISYELFGGSNYNDAPTEYNSGTGTAIDGTPTKANSDFLGWCTDSTLETCSESITISAEDFGDKKFYAKWETNTYTIRYLDEDGNVLLPDTTWNVGETQSFDIPTPELEENMSFFGWFESSDFSEVHKKDKITNINYEYLATKASENNLLVLYGLKYMSPQFMIDVDTSKNPSDPSLQLHLTPKGTFYIDWDDGTLQKIVKTNTSRIHVYHTYQNQGTYKAKLSGLATAYSTTVSRPVGASTYDTQDFVITIGTYNVVGISGSLGAIFPTIDDGSTLDKQPRFGSTFEQSPNLTGQIPADLFKGVHGAPVRDMFSYTFSQTKLTGPIPRTLFCEDPDNPTPENCLYGAPAPQMFKGVFALASELTGQIPDGLFAGIRGEPAPYMYAFPFWGCSKLTGPIPENLFANIHGAPAEKMYHAAFFNSSNLGKDANGVPTYSIPDRLFGTFDNNAPAPYMFSKAFSNTGLTGPIPEHLFDTISGPIQPYSFNETFKDAKNLTGEIPTNLFGNITGVADSAFANTFKGATNIGKDENGEATPIPVNLFKNISGDITGTSMFAGTFEDTQYLTSPVPTELFKGITGFLEDNATGTRTSTYTSGGMKNIFNNSNIPTVCDAGQYQYLTGFEVDWNGRVACEICPENFPDSTSGDNVTINKCYTDCPADEHGGTYVSGHKYWTSDSVGDTSSCTYKYNISYDLGNVDASLTDNHPTEYTSAMSSNLTVPFPEYGEYISFDGWFNNSELQGDAISEIPVGSVGDIKLYAKWNRDQFNIVYDYTNGGSGCANEKYSFGVEKDITCVPEYTGHIFTGWFDAPINGNQVITIPNTSTGDVTLYAQWQISEFNVIYDYTNGGSGCANEKYSFGVEKDITCVPEYTGHIFTGWFDAPINGNQVTTIPDTTTGDVTLYAQWERSEFNVIYDYTNGGSGCANEKYSFGVEKDITCVPEYTGHIFTGWFDAPTNGNKVITIPNTSTGDVILYAQWTPMSYYIEYVLNGGTNYENAPNAYTYGFETLIDGTPTKKDFLFDGWCTDEELTQCYDTYTISNTSVGKVILYIKWKFNCETNKWLHIGENENDKICLSDTKPDGLAVAVQTDVSTYYIPLYNDSLHINKDSTKTMRILYKNKEYSVHDKSVQ